MRGSQAFADVARAMPLVSVDLIVASASFAPLARLTRIIAQNLKSVATSII
jgi:hypothetical protein